MKTRKLVLFYVNLSLYYVLTLYHRWPRGLLQYVQNQFCLLFIQCMWDHPHHKSQRSQRQRKSSDKVKETLWRKVLTKLFIQALNWKGVHWLASPALQFRSKYLVVIPQKWNLTWSHTGAGRCSDSPPSVHVAPQGQAGSSSSLPGGQSPSCCPICSLRRLGRLDKALISVSE